MEELKTLAYWNILNSKLEFQRSDLENYIKDNYIDDFNSDYHCVCITGNQSSGKSTLLNNMFELGFPTKALNAGQTTLGADMAHDYENKLLHRIKNLIINSF